MTRHPLPNPRYEAAAAEDIPAYKVEVAKTGRSVCVAAMAEHGAEPKIGKGELRFGSFNPVAGTYGRWSHMGCWRVRE